MFSTGTFIWDLLGVVGVDLNFKVNDSVHPKHCDHPSFVIFVISDMLAPRVFIAPLGFNVTMLEGRTFIMVQSINIIIKYTR
jgi:hypothetical protein